MGIEEIKELSAYELAGMADCGSPDSNSSPGALMLASVRDAVIGKIESGEITRDDFDDSGQLHEIADSAPDVYTFRRWQQFVDLAAWQEEPESDEWPTDLTDMAGVALYQIADRLARALVDAWMEDSEGDSDDDMDGTD